MARLKIYFIGGLSEFIPRATELAVVATVNAIADQRPQRFRNAAVHFDRQIRNAAARIHLLRADNGAGGADIDARAASATVFGDLRWIDWQWQIRINFTEKKPRAGAAVDQHRIFADPAETGFLREAAFQYRRAI